MHSPPLIARRPRLGSLAALPWVLLVGCGSDPAGPLTSADVVGTYALQSINGYPVPAPFGQGTALIFDTLTVARDSTILERQGAGALGSNVVTYPGTYTGRWTLDATGAKLVLTYAIAEGNPLTLTYTVVNRGASLTFDAGPVTSDPGGGLWVYHRVR